MRVMYPDLFILLDLIIVIMCGEEWLHNLCSPSLRLFIFSVPVTSPSLFKIEIFVVHVFLI
jgi:hypothetical protein